MNTERLIALREQHGLSQEALGEAVGVTQPFMCYIEKGFKTPSLAVLKRIAKLLECTVDEII